MIYYLMILDFSNLPKNYINHKVSVSRIPRKLKLEVSDNVIVQIVAIRKKQYPLK